MNSGNSTYIVKKGLSLRSKHIFYSSGISTSCLFKAEAKGGRHHNWGHII